MKNSGKEQTNERKANRRNKTIGRVKEQEQNNKQKTSKQKKYNETMTEPKVRHYKRDRTNERRKDRKISR